MQGCLAGMVGFVFWLTVALAIVGKVGVVLVIIALATVFIYVWGQSRRGPPDDTGKMWR